MTHITEEGAKNMIGSLAFHCPTWHTPHPTQGSHPLLEFLDGESENLAPPHCWGVEQGGHWHLSVCTIPLSLRA